MSIADVGHLLDQTALSGSLRWRRPDVASPDFDGSIDLYDDLDLYLAACADPVGIAGRLPVFRPAARYELTSCNVNWTNWSARIAEAHGKPLGTSLAVGEDTRSAVALIGRPASVFATLFAARTDRSLHLVDSLVEAVGSLAMPHSSSTLFAAPEDADDLLLFGMLGAVERMLPTDRPWDDLPRYALITGRDLAALSWMTAKLIAAASRSDAGIAGMRGVRVRRYASADSGSNVCDSTQSPDGSTSANSKHLRQSELLASYRDRIDVMAFHAHGSEACAKGGDGTVLCGLHRTDAVFEPQAEGVLACGRGQPCPRGPHPVPLRQMATDVLMLATCNGLRLADSRTRPEFNFGLSFIDGDGLAYVSSAFSCSGGGAASIAFPAAMAAGCTVGEATVLINGLLHHARLDRIAFIAIADPEHRATAPARIRLTTGRLPTCIDLGSHHFAELVIADPRVLDAARNETLILTVTSDQGCEIVGYHRVQRCRDGSLAVVAMLFGFPNHLGRIHVVMADRRLASDQALATLARVDNWAELLRQFQIESANPEACEDFAALRHRLCLDVGRSLGALGIDGGTLIHLQRQLAFGDQLALATSEQLQEHLVPKLQGAFWLSNAQAEQYTFERSESAPCPTCRQPAFRRIMRHSTRGGCRTVMVCPKCGIGSDIGGGSAMTAINIEAPSLVMAGEELRLTVVVHVARATTVTMHPRLSTHDEFVAPPVPATAVFQADGPGAVRSDFVLNLPRELSPHRHYVKVLLACADSLAFASRPLFVQVASDAREDVS